MELVILGLQALYVFMETPCQLLKDQSSLHRFKGAGPGLDWSSWAGDLSQIPPKAMVPRLCVLGLGSCRHVPVPSC